MSAPPTELCNYHDNYSQQRPDSAGQGKVKRRCLPVRDSSKHCSLLKGLCQNKTPLALPPRHDPPTHCQGSSWAIQLCRPRWQDPYIFGDRIGLELGCDRRQAKTQWPLLTKSDMQYISFNLFVFVSNLFLNSSGQESKLRRLFVLK